MRERVKDIDKIYRRSRQEVTHTVDEKQYMNFKGE